MQVRNPQLSCFSRIEYIFSLSHVKREAEWFRYEMTMHSSNADLVIRGSFWAMTESVLIASVILSRMFDFLLNFEDSIKLNT